MNLDGKVVRSLKLNPQTTSQYDGVYGGIVLRFTDSSVLIVRPWDDNCVDVELIEPTLNSDVIPIGADTLGEGSV